MKKTTDSATLHNSFVKGSQENLQENVTGANSLPTQAPTEFDKSVIVQSSPEEFDAVAKAELIIEKRYTKKEAFYVLVDKIHNWITASEHHNKESEFNAIINYLWLDYII